MGAAEEEGGGDATLSMMSFIYMCYGFAIVHGNSPWGWGPGATNPERCGTDTWAEMTIVFDVVFSFSMLSLTMCCFVLCFKVSGLHQP